MAYPSRNNVSAYSHSAQKAAVAIRSGIASTEQRVTPRLKVAVAAMVFQGQTRQQAAQTAGLTDDALRKALLKPVVLAHLNEQIEVLRTSARPRALTRVIELVDQKESLRVALEAAKYIDGMDRPSHTMGAINVQVLTR